MSSKLYPLATERTARSDGPITEAYVSLEDSLGPPIEHDPLLEQASASTPSATTAEIFPQRARSLPRMLPEIFRQRARSLPRMLQIADLLALALAFVFAQPISGHNHLSLGWAALSAPLLLLLGARCSGLYDRDEGLLRKTTLEEAPGLFQLATLCALATWLSAGLLEHVTFPPGSVLALWLALSVLLILTRSVARLLQMRLSPAERCVFIGDEHTERAFCSKLANHATIDATIVARFGPGEFHDCRLDGDFVKAVAKIHHLVGALRVQRAIVAAGVDTAESARDLLYILQAAGVKVSALPGHLDALGPSVEFDDLDGMTIMDVRHSELISSSALLKRIFDLTGTLIALLALSPVTLAIAIAIKLDTRGPVFFRQLRVGRHGRPFQMIKFRTMVHDAESLKGSLVSRNQALTGLFKINDDPRVTRVGKFLRKTSLDELPQLLNVLSGEMSLVGPRPLILEEDRRVEGWQRRRLEMRPGITGPWQILGPRRVSLWEMANIDNRYQLDRSMWRDITILLRTMGHIFARRGL